MEEDKVYKEGSLIKSNMLPGDRNGSPDESLGSTFVFIDAGFLEKLSKHFWGGRYLKFDRFRFAENLAKAQRLVCKRIFYYTAPPFQSNNPTKEEEKRKEGYDKFIKKLFDKRIIVREGRCQRLKMNGSYSFNQKAVDILLAMDLMNVALRFRNIKKIILVSSDSDFVLIIKNLEENGVKTVLGTYYEKSRNSNFSRSNYLIKSVHKYTLLRKEDFLNCPIKPLEGIRNEKYLEN